MEIINKSDEKLLAEYEQFASTSKYGNFMQSLKWPKVKDNWGWDAVISRDANGNIRGTCLIIIKKVPIFGVTFMYAPHGPVCDWSDKKVMTDLFEGVKVLAKKYKCYQLCGILVSRRATTSVQSLSRTWASSTYTRRLS